VVRPASANLCSKEENGRSQANLCSWLISFSHGTATTRGVHKLRSKAVPTIVRLPKPLEPDSGDIIHGEGEREQEGNESKQQGEETSARQCDLERHEYDGALPGTARHPDQPDAARDLGGGTRRSRCDAPADLRVGQHASTNFGVDR
jgi:hypothetical protein